MKNLCQEEDVVIIHVITIVDTDTIDAVVTMDITMAVASAAMVADLEIVVSVAVVDLVGFHYYYYLDAGKTLKLINKI